MTDHGNLDILEHPTQSVGSVSLLSFLTEAVTATVRSDPVALRYEAEPDQSAQPLMECYDIEPVDDGRLQISRRAEATIAQSLPLDFLTIAGAALAYAPRSRVPRLTTIYRATTDEPSGSTRASTESVLTQCLLRFWNDFNPDASLIREFRVQIDDHRARTIFDFDRLQEAIREGKLQSQSQTPERLAQQLPNLIEIDCINDQSALRDFLQEWSEILDIDLWTHRDRVRVQWGNRGSENCSLFLSELAEPLLSTLLHGLLTLDVRLQYGENDFSWYLPGNEFDVTDFVADYRGETTAATHLAEFNSEEICSFFGIDDDNNELTKYTDMVPVVPSVLPFITRGKLWPESSDTKLIVNYKHAPYLRQLVSGLMQWGPDNVLPKITINYATRAKIALDINNKRCRSGTNIDEYVASHLPEELGWSSDRIELANLKLPETLGLVEQHFGSIQQIAARPEATQQSLEEIRPRATPDIEYKDAYQKESRIELRMAEQLETAAAVLWYDMFHPDSPLQIRGLENLPK